MVFPHSEYPQNGTLYKISPPWKWQGYPTKVIEVYETLLLPKSHSKVELMVWYLVHPKIVCNTLTNTYA